MAEKQSVYIETTIPSYKTGRESRDMVVATHQVLTRQFWEDEREKYDLFISQYVIDECKRGNNDNNGLWTPVLVTPEDLLPAVVFEEETK